jgi:U6 snRNA-associated Sm-like protein LSm6
MSRKEALTQFIQQIHGRPVVVKLNSGVDYRGKFFTTQKFY